MKEPSFASVDRNRTSREINKIILETNHLKVLKCLKRGVSLTLRGRTRSWTNTAKLCTAARIPANNTRWRQRYFAPEKRLVD